MAFTSITNATASPLAASTPSARSDSVLSGVGTTLAGLGTAASDGVSATVSFSGKALHALEHAGEATVDAVANGASSIAGAASSVADEVGDAAVGAWHAVQHAAHDVEQVGASIVDAVSDGVNDVTSAAKTIGRELGHYAEVGLSATGEAVSEIASGSVMAASAVGKTIIALI